MLALNKTDEAYALPQPQNPRRTEQVQPRKKRLTAERSTALREDGNHSSIIRVAFPGAQPARQGDRALSLYVREIGKVKPLTPREELELVGRIRKGDRQARERLIKGKLRLVVKISREYENIGLPLLDLISEGNVGLLKAVERFDPAKDSSFSACSTWWIKRSIKRALASQCRQVAQS